RARCDLLRGLVEHAAARRTFSRTVATRTDEDTAREHQQAHDDDRRTGARPRPGTSSLGTGLGGHARSLRSATTAHGPTDTSVADGPELGTRARGQVEDEGK